MSGGSVGGTSIGSTSAAARQGFWHGRISRTIARLAVFGLLGGSAVQAEPASGRGAPAEDAGISVRVCVNLAVRATTRRVVAETLQEEIARIWRSNGVEVVYARAERYEVCPGAVSRTLVLWILDSEADLPPGITVGGGALGSTLATQGALRDLMFVFVTRVEQWVAGHGGGRSVLVPVHFSTLLARVAAHEMGHALLRSAAHSDRGLMRAHFDTADLRLAESNGFLLTRGERLALQGLTATTVATAAQGSAGVEGPLPRR